MKPWHIAVKDTLIRFRDRNAILLMIAAPLLIAFVMGAAFGGQSGGTSPISEIPLILVNADEGDLSKDFAEIITEIEVDTADGTKGLFTVTEMTDKAAAIEQVELGEVSGVVYIPPDFSETLNQSFDPDSGNTFRTTALVEVYTDPAANVSPGIIRGVVSRIASGFSTVVIGNMVAVDQLTSTLKSANRPPSAEVLANLENLEEIISEANTSFAETEGPRERINLSTQMAGESEEFNLLNYFVPSMAIFFLMFAVFDGTRSILEEERDGTLHRLMTTPTGRSQILLGKIGGTFLTGILQFSVLVAASAIFFSVDWGKSPLGVTLMAIATVTAATSLGAFVASFARDVNQAGVLGTAITLVFAILGGNFISYEAMEGFLGVLSKLTVNRWALEGFVELTLGSAPVSGVLPHVGVLFGMAALFFVLSIVMFNRRFVK
jgi:ABC-2 type transport system permease protein